MLAQSRTIWLAAAPLVSAPASAVCDVDGKHGDHTLVSDGSGVGHNNPHLSAALVGFAKHDFGLARSGIVEYQCVATSVIGFVQQVATAYLPHGYWFYVTGTIPPHKDPRTIDAKLLAKYGIAVSRSARARRKQAGHANLHYLRHERFFVILATHGRHAFFDDEARRLRDIRREPLIYAGYSISYKRGGHRRRSADGKPTQRDDRWHSRVQMARGVYTDWRAYFVDVATKRSANALTNELRRLPFEPYAPVRQQLLNLLRLVNQARRTAGMDPVPADALRYRRRIVRPFEPFDDSAVDDRNQEGRLDGNKDKFD